MSHACVFVAVDVVDPNDRAEIEAAVAFQMAPYDENEEWFRDGSRWDWYVIGGRWEGFLNPDYDPDKDPRNHQTCTICGGTGIRPGGREQFGEDWFKGCNGCNGCSGTGTERKWQNAPTLYSVMQIKVLDKSKIPVASAFLRERHWHEGERMGWFGMSHPTECELKAEANDSDMLTRRCVTTGDENAKIVVWNEPWEIWEKQFNHRFIEPLKPETVLVVVDYHV